MAFCFLTPGQKQDLRRGREGRRKGGAGAGEREEGGEGRCHLSALLTSHGCRVKQRTENELYK